MRNKFVKSLISIALSVSMMAAPSMSVLADTVNYEPNTIEGEASTEDAMGNEIADGEVITDSEARQNVPELQELPEEELPDIMMETAIEPSGTEVSDSIKDAVEAARNISLANEDEVRDIAEAIESIREDYELLSGEEREALENSKEALDNAALAVENMQSALDEQNESGEITIDEGVENSWRFINGQPVEDALDIIDQESDVVEAIENEEDPVIIEALKDGVASKINADMAVTSSKADVILVSSGKADGVDVSYHNGIINWSAYKNSGLKYAILRCGYGSDSTSQDDKKWAYNVSECERLGIPYGVYLYSYAANLSQVDSEVAHTLRLLKGHNPQFPVYYDLEENSQYAMGSATVCAFATRYCNKILAAGYSTGVYSSTNWWKTRYAGSSMVNNKDYSHWVAQYNTSCTYTGRVDMWQYTSSGSAAGISGRVDMNHWYLDMPTGKTAAQTEYTVTFKDSVDGKTLKAETVDKNGAATAPAAPAHNGYTFTGWDKSFNKVTSDIVVTAIYKKNKYTVTFKDAIDGKTLKTQSVEYGSAATAPSIPFHPGYIFSKWDKSFNKVTAAVTVTGQFKIKNDIYTVNGKKYYYVNGNVQYGAKKIGNYYYYFDDNTGVMLTNTFKYIPRLDATYYYDTNGHLLYGPTIKVNGNTYKLEKSTGKLLSGPLTYTVTFKDSLNGKVIKTRTVSFNKAVSAPTAPSHTGYTFSKWDIAFNKVNSNLTVNAIYKANKYKVTFKDGIDGKVIKTQTVEYGKDATAPKAPTHKGYKFQKWDKSFNKITKKITVTAKYKKS